MKLFKIIVLCLLGTWTNCHSQQLSRQVLVPLAGLASGSKVNYSQTVGETAVAIFSCPDYIFTQGFQQPGYKKVGEIEHKGTGVNVYPNPVTDYITIELFGESSRTFRVDFINITGTIILSEKKVFNEKFWCRDPLNVESLARGFYLVRVESEDGMINRIFKVEKL